MRLIIPVLLNCLVAAVIYLAGKYTPAKKLPHWAKQILIGLLFGGVSAFSSSYGVEWLGTVVNVRDAAPLTAGLIFGGPSGILAGFIGGLYRWFSVYWGGGTYTRVACTLATILAGFLAAGVRKLMFDDKKATWGYAISISVVCEVIHMMLIFLTNMDDSSYAFEFVRGASVPMILGNAAAVGVSVIIISLFSHEKLTHRKSTEQIAQTFQRWLLLCIAAACLFTGVFTFMLQDGIVRVETQKVFTTAIDDVMKDVRGKSDAYMLDVVRKIARRHEDAPATSLASLAKENRVMEINVVDENNIIVRSTHADQVGFDMSSTEQSKAFTVLNMGAKTFVQEYCAMGSDSSTMRKYAGVALKGGGFLQVGYSADQFHDMLNGFVMEVTKNRRVGSEGFVMVCDEDFSMVTDSARNGQHISTLGIEPNGEMLAGKTATQLYRAEIANRYSGKVEEYIFVYTFVEGYCIIAAMPFQEAMFMRDASLYNSVFMQILIFATLFVFIYFLIKRVIINNIRKINQTLAQITEGNLNVTVDVRSNEEFASLSDDINSTVATLKRYIAEAAARIDKELEYAKQIQLSALPKDFPEEEAYAIRAQMIAAKEVGGDFYDYYRLGPDTLAFLVADVSGKGIPAAMFMMTAKTILKDLAESGIPVNEIFTRANEKLCENNDSGMFVTAWMGILELSTGKLQYANAGHNPPVLKHADGRFQLLRSRPGFVLAGMEGVRYRVGEMQLQPGDRIFLYTDGVTEATDTENRLYGEDRLLAYLNSVLNAPGADLLPGLKEDIDLFVGAAPQFDDITMLLLDYQPQKGGEPVIEKVFPAQIEALDDVLGFVEQTLEGFGCSMKISTAVCVAIEEVFVNVAHYAYGEGQGDVELSIGFQEDTRKVTFRMADGGVPFDPLKKPDPDITLSAEERQIGGLGIFITKKTMDSVSYAYENGKNILTMIKSI